MQSDDKGKDADRLTWCKPTLKQFGPVQGLTLGSGGSNGDGQLGMSRGGMMWNNNGMGNGMGNSMMG